MLIASYREKGWVANRSEFFAIFAAILTIGCLGCLYLFGFTFWLYEYPHGGNFWGMLFAVPIYVSCIIGLAMLLALGGYARTSRTFNCCDLSASVSINRYSLATSAMPEWMQFLAWLLPSTHGVQMFVQLNQMGVATSLLFLNLFILRR
jgi:ABC-2 type transport system permease protein